MRKVDILNMGGLIVSLMVLCSAAISSPLITIANNWSSDFRPYGGYIYEILFIGTGDGGNALLSNDIDAYGEDVFPQYIGALINDPNTAVDFSLSLGHRAIVLNSGRFPTNITGFRRAMAFGMDKHLINMQAGNGGDPLDSYIPIAAKDWEVESQMNMHFYDADYVSGNASLAAAGFLDLDHDGWREYDVNHNEIWDEGTDLDDLECSIQILYSEAWYSAFVTSIRTTEGLQAMGIRAEVVEMPHIIAILNEMYSGNYWAGCLNLLPSIFALPTDIYGSFRTGEYDADNFFYFSNDSIDTALDNLMNAKNVSDAKAASAEVMNLLVYEQPMIACYNDLDVNGYRVDNFEGLIPFNGHGIVDRNNPYVGTKVRLQESKGGPYGGTFRYGTTAYCAPDNILDLRPYSNHYLNYIYERLWNVDPLTWDPIPGLAYNWIVEPTSNDPVSNIQTGEKYTFYLYEDATWHDGHPVTSEDVKYSFETLWPNATEFNPVKQKEINDIYRIDTPDDHTVIMYVNKTGYFEWKLATSHFILPKHIWEPHSNNLTGWMPITRAEMTGSGPYKWNSSLWGEYISLIRHEDWHWDIRDVPLTATTQSTRLPETSLNIPLTSATTSSSDRIPGFDIFMVISLFGATIYIIRKRKDIN
ncbi:MAG: ABC transporter substrate-binding protein [Candidatus Hermodarchaeota archaeon]